MKTWLVCAALAAATVLLLGCNRQDPYSHPAQDRWANPAGTPSDRTGGSRPVPVWHGRFPNNRVPESNPGRESAGKADHGSSIH